MYPRKVAASLALLTYSLAPTTPAFAQSLPHDTQQVASGATTSSSGATEPHHEGWFSLNFASIREALVEAVRKLAEKLGADAEPPTLDVTGGAPEQAFSKDDLWSIALEGTFDSSACDTAVDVTSLRAEAVQVLHDPSSVDGNGEARIQVIEGYVRDEYPDESACKLVEVFTYITDNPDDAVGVYGNADNYSLAQLNETGTGIHRRRLVAGVDDLLLAAVVVAAANLYVSHKALEQLDTRPDAYNQVGTISDVPRVECSTNVDSSALATSEARREEVETLLSDDGDCALAFTYNASSRYFGTVSTQGRDACALPGDELWLTQDNPVYTHLTQMFAKLVSRANEAGALGLALWLDNLTSPFQPDRDADGTYAVATGVVTLAFEAIEARANAVCFEHSALRRTILHHVAAQRKALEALHEAALPDIDTSNFEIKCEAPDPSDSPIPKSEEMCIVLSEEHHRFLARAPRRGGTDSGSDDRPVRPNLGNGGVATAAPGSDGNNDSDDDDGPCHVCSPGDIAAFDAFACYQSAMGDSESSDEDGAVVCETNSPELCLPSRMDGVVICNGNSGVTVNSNATTVHAGNHAGNGYSEDSAVGEVSQDSEDSEVGEVSQDSEGSEDSEGDTLVVEIDEARLEQLRDQVFQLMSEHARYGDPEFEIESALEELVSSLSYWTEDTFTDHAGPVFIPHEVVRAATQKFVNRATAFVNQELARLRAVPSSEESGWLRQLWDYVQLIGVLLDEALCHVTRMGSCR